MTAEPPTAPQLPVGTHVVLRGAGVDEDGSTVQRGATGAITDRLADGRYRIRLPDGRQVLCRRADVNLRRAHQAALAQGEGQVGRAEELVRDRTIFAAVVGSRAFGLATSSSDTDVRGVYVAPTPLFWSLSKPPTHVDGPEPEQVSWEVERFCELALKANPNALEVLWSPLVIVRTPAGAELVALRDAFLGGALAKGARRGHPVQRLVGTAVGVDQDRAVGLDHQDPGRHREVRRQPAGVVDLAAGDDESHER